MKNDARHHPRLQNKKEGEPWKDRDSRKIDRESSGGFLPPLGIFFTSLIFLGNLLYK